MPFPRTLFVGAHADDIELFAGGLLAMAGEKGKAHCLTFSAHEGVQDSEVVKKTTEEHITNMKAVGASYVLYHLNACDGNFLKERDFIYKEVLRMVRTHGIELVVTHQGNDTNQDHRQVYEEVVRSCKGECSIITGEFPFNTVDASEPNLLIELESHHLLSKLSGITSYKSQYTPLRKYFSKEYWTALAITRGVSTPSLYAEGFHVVRLRFPTLFQ